MPNFHSFPLCFEGTHDLEGHASLLEPGIMYNLPLLTLDGVVLCPGDTLPHRLLLASDRLAVRQALDAEPPVRRLLAVVLVNCQEFEYRTSSLQFESIGCTAEIVKTSSDLSVIIAVGRQRIQIAFENIGQPINLRNIPVRVLPDNPPTPISRSIADGAGVWPPWIVQKVDCNEVMARARSLFAVRMPNARCYDGTDPVRFSFWLVSNLPFDNAQRQKLLEVPDVTVRLNLELEWLKKIQHVRCLTCYHEVARAIDSAPLDSGDLSARFVNSHAFIHDVLTVSRATNVEAVGDPEIQHSWFPGYAWQIAYCASCHCHLGWKFTRERGTELNINESGETMPESFWGLRRAAVTPNTFANSISMELDEFGVFGRGSEAAEVVRLLNLVDDTDDENDAVYASEGFMSDQGLEETHRA